jgi:cell division protein FtsW
MRLFGKHNKSNIGEFNLRLFLTVLFLLAFGLIALYSASTVESYKNFGTTTRYILHQVIYGAGGGLVCLFFFYKFDYHNFKKFLPLLLGASVLLLLFVKFSAFSHNAGGAERWLRIGGNTFQPSELIKITIIVYLAAWIERKKDLLHDFYNGLLPSLLVVGVISFLIEIGSLFIISLK